MWKETDVYQQNSNDLENDIFYSYSNNDCNNNINFQMKLGFDPEETKKINLGEVQSELIHNEKVYTFYFNSFNHNKENDFLIHFYPLDCNIRIISQKENDANEIEFEKISNYEYNAFYAIIKKDKINSTFFKIKTLMNSVNDYNKNRTFHLIINSFEYINDTNLTIKEKEPILLNFNNTINKINLLYNLTKQEIYIHPISVSFFIKERVKFKITVSNNEDIPFEKIIYYTDRILIDPNFFSKNFSYINIYIEKIEKKDAVLIAKVIGDYSTPIYFQKNILNIGFIPSNTSYQYYYMEVFKGEEGQIILNNKKYKGILISKIIEKEEVNKCNIFNNSECYPEENERNNSLLSKDYLKYDEYSQNLTLENIQTNKCVDGCYLLITYYSIYFSDKNSNKKIIGTDFTLSSILLEENEVKSQIINIPFNENIFGVIDSSSHNIHYYSIYIPEKTKEIQLELHLFNINIYFYEGIKRFNIYKSNSLSSNYGTYIKNIADLIGGQYYTFALNNNIRESNYYFKIFQGNSDNNISIYPLDTNKANICLTKEINGFFSCFFLIDNIYKDLYNDIIIYAYGKKKVEYTAWYEGINETNAYSINIKKLNGSRTIERQNNIFLKIDKEKYIYSKYFLISIQSNYSENLTILTNFYDNLSFFPSFQIFSNQLIYLYPDENFTFSLDYSLNEQYRILINNTKGEGRICFDDNCTVNKYQSLISGKRILSFIVKNETKNINIINRLKVEAVFNIRIDYGSFTQGIEELQFNTYSKSEPKILFPVEYILKDIDYNGADINFYFDFNNSEINKDEIITFIKRFIKRKHYIYLY